MTKTKGKSKVQSILYRESGHKDHIAVYHMVLRGEGNTDLLRGKFMKIQHAPEDGMLILWLKRQEQPLIILSFTEQCSVKYSRASLNCGLWGPKATTAA